MKMKHIFLLILVGLILSACKQNMIVKPVKKFDVTFKVKNTSGVYKLEIDDKDRGCKKEDNKGCLRVPEANSGNITFGFSSAMPLPCTSHRNSWFISKIELANIEGGFGKPVNDWIVKDFGLKNTNGVVWERAVGQEVASVEISDANHFSGVVYYQVTAESCDSSKDPINTDPRVINEGGSNM